MEDVDGFKLLGSKVFFKKVLEYFKGVAKVKFIYVPSKRKSFLKRWKNILTTQVESTLENVGMKTVPSELTMSYVEANKCCL